jgi:hypothetical protein
LPWLPRLGYVRFIFLVSGRKVLLLINVEITILNLGISIMGKFQILDFEISKNCENFKTVGVFKF